ncbi:flavin reductase family protein [Nonomuraea sediminis]|uniref:flavin reductase family protein n=1 Tax=Nonomuraea sediminis TaxID=2835864 RepID=UPI001BDD8F27|nr:flavin reductase family protein [Nonomuraea sediminis]
MSQTTVRARPVNGDAFRDLMGAFPSGVSVVTTADTDMTPYGLTCSSLCSVSVCPPTLLVCIDNRSGTLAALLRRGTFAINFLHSEGCRAARLFASGDPDRFSGVVWRPSPTWSLPYLVEDAHAIAECELLRTVVASDHTVVLGHVMDIDRRPAPPLLYGLRRFAPWPCEGVLP